MSTTRNGSASPEPTSSRVAPMKDSAASSSPVTTSGSTPRRSRTPATNSSRFSTSREAEVATNRTRSAPVARTAAA